MRIISGYLKGRSINFIKNLKTRPLKDSVKENIFNILKHSSMTDVKIDESNVLDLYSGVGSFGIESISRGAAHVTFLEKNSIAAKILNENLIKLSIIDKTELINTEVEKYLNQKNKKKFNIFFFDPPYSDRSFLGNLILIKQNNLFKKKNIVIIHRERKTKDNFGNCLDILDIKIYGRSKIIFGEINSKIF